LCVWLFLTSLNVLSCRERKEDRDRHKGKSEVSALAGLTKGRIKKKVFSVCMYN